MSLIRPLKRPTIPLVCGCSGLGNTCFRVGSDSSLTIKRSVNLLGLGTKHSLFLAHDHTKPNNYQVPCDYMPKRSYPLFMARDILAAIAAGDE